MLGGRRLGAVVVRRRTARRDLHRVAVSCINRPREVGATGGLFREAARLPLRFTPARGGCVHVVKRTFLTSDYGRCYDKKSSSLYRKRHVKRTGRVFRRLARPDVLEGRAWRQATCEAEPDNQSARHISRWLLPLPESQ